MFIPKKSLIVPGEMGLFTLQSIQPNKLLFESFTPNPLGGGSSFFDKAYTQSEQNSFINHSNTPNTITVFRNGTFYRYSTRYIKEHEEITSNYIQTLQLIAKMGYCINADWLFFLDVPPNIRLTLPKISKAIL